MIKNSHDRFQKPSYILYPGEFFATQEDCVIETVTSLCIAVCLYEPQKGIGGMGHFIVPGKIGRDLIITSDVAARGITSMEYLIGDIVKAGGDRKNLHAKIFGAGYSVFNVSDEKEISESNIRFIQEYFSIEKIEIDRIDLGGEFRRKLFFFTKNGVIYRKILKNNDEDSEFTKMEKNYIIKEHERVTIPGKIVLFK